MTLQRVIIPGLSTDEQKILNQMVDQLIAKTPRNMLRSAYYDGKRAISETGLSIPPQMQRTRLVLGWASKAVDILNDRCNLDGFTVPSGVDLDSVGLQDLWDNNFLDVEAPQVGTSSLIHSVAFLFTTEGDPAAGEPPVLINAKDALSATGIWDVRQRRLTAALSIIDRDEDGLKSFRLYFDNLVLLCEKQATGAWTVDELPHSYGVPVEPVPFDPRLDRMFGRSRISRVVMSLHNAAIRTAIRSEVTAELYSVPQRVLLGANESAFQNADGTVKPVWQAIMGRIWAIGDDEDASNPRADVKEFSGASQQPHIDQLRAQAQQFAGETSIPIASLGLGAAEANPTSADAYYASREDLIRRAESTTDGWSPAWRRTMLRALQMSNGWDEVPDEFKRLRPMWRNPITTSRAAASDAAQKMITTFPWLAQSELGLELFGMDPGFLERAKAELRRQRGRSTLDQLVAATRQLQAVPNPNGAPPDQQPNAPQVINNAQPNSAA